MLLARLSLAFAFSLAALPALAHHPMGGTTPTTFMQGLLSGIGHPILGLDHLAALIAELSATWSTADRPRDLRLAAEPLRLPTDRAVSLGVIVTELVSNACKYAYPDGAGEVRVALTRDGDARFRLSVEDDGIGIVDAAPKGTGVGTRLIRAMAQSLDSVVEYDPAHRGTRAVLAGVTGLG